jgi:hypothetical protein
MTSARALTVTTTLSDCAYDYTLITYEVQY